MVRVGISDTAAAGAHRTNVKRADMIILPTLAHVGAIAFIIPDVKSDPIPGYWLLFKQFK